MYLNPGQVIKPVRSKPINSNMRCIWILKALELDATSSINSNMRCIWISNTAPTANPDYD